MLINSLSDKHAHIVELFSGFILYQLHKLLETIGYNATETLHLILIHQYYTHTHTVITLNMMRIYTCF